MSYAKVLGATNRQDGYLEGNGYLVSWCPHPTIFLTAKTLKEDILEGFKIGADDYITKPFSMEELVFRVEAILRRRPHRGPQAGKRACLEELDQSCMYQFIARLASDIATDKLTVHTDAFA